MKKIFIYGILLFSLTILVIISFTFNQVENIQKNPEPETLREGKTVIIANMAFVPAMVIIEKGQKVTWKNDDSTVHNIASDPHPSHTDLPSLVSDNILPGQNYSFVFNETGSFSYHCHLHPEMKGTVVVND